MNPDRSPDQCCLHLSESCAHRGGTRKAPSSVRVPQTSGVDAKLHKSHPSRAKNQRESWPGLADSDCRFLGNSALWRSRTSTQSGTGQRSLAPKLPFPIPPLWQSHPEINNLGTPLCACLLPFPICSYVSKPCSNPASSTRKPSPEPNSFPPRPALSSSEPKASTLDSDTAQRACF